MIPTTDLAPKTCSLWVIFFSYSLSTDILCLKDHTKVTAAQTWVCNICQHLERRCHLRRAHHQRVSKERCQFSAMLNSVRCGCQTAETIGTLQEWLIQGSIADKFIELRERGQSSVCLFPRRKACNDFNSEMLSRLTSEVHELPCTDEVDETHNPCKWNKKKTAEKLAKLNEDCNMTAGLEAKLLLAVGARVMLRRNIDTNTGLVNGAIGTVVSVRPNHVTVQFDHTNTLYNVEKVKSRFTIMIKISTFTGGSFH